MRATGPHVPVRRLAQGSRTVGDLFCRRAELSHHKPAIYEKHDGRWRATSWAEFHTEARRVAQGLASCGLARGDRVAILGPTRAPWAIYDMGAQLFGAVSLGIYPKQPPDALGYILEHSGARVLFVDGADELERTLEAIRSTTRLDHVVPWTEELFEATRHLDRRITSPSRFAGEPLGHDAIAAAQRCIEPDDTAILIYTSGTTGPPKGARIAHSNILAVLASQAEELQLFEDDLSLNFLPMAHAAERVFGFYARIGTGITTAYASSMGHVLEEIREVRPTLFGSVPRIFEKAYAKLQGELDRKPRAARRAFEGALRIGRMALPYLLAARPLPPPLRASYAAADALVFRKIRAAFGGRVRWFVCGAAPIAREILELFWIAGMPIYEAYGMTESTVVTHMNLPGHTKLGTVGRTATCLECRIAEDGEVLVRGPFVFKGYLDDEGATRETIRDGWLHTGDVGTLDADGYLRITDRKKHLIITAGGKNLSPANIENAIKNQSPLVSQVHAHGDRRPYVSALVAPSPLETLELGVELGLLTAEDLAARTRELLSNPTGRSADLERAMARVVGHPQMVERVRLAVRAGNRELGQVEQVRRFVLLDRDFSQERGELTPTMKLKRKAIEQGFAEVFDRLYRESGFAIDA
ncbi:MAG: long-chain fatty acid--CoA ligase [Deltaproteobacteria bacterium]|nr:long-chain fatty acid--CoA ligase [Deltaproteobacteria bacterium]